jgi:putative flippase GtrA
MHSFNYLFYRYRFLLLYIAFGIISLLVELFVARALISFNISSFFSLALSFIVGLITAFGLNIRFNFHIAQPKRQRALLYFTLISSVSYLVQYFFRQKNLFFLLSIGPMNSLNSRKKLLTFFNHKKAINVINCTYLIKTF